MKNERIILVLLAALQFTNIMDFMILMPLGPQLMRVFGVDAEGFGMLVSAYTFSAGVSGFIGAFVIDRFDRRRVLLTIYSGFLIGTLACALSPTEAYLMASRIFTGLFGGLMSATVLSIVADIIPLERRSAAMGLVMMAFSLASVFGVPFGLYLANLYGWHAPFFFLVAAAALMLPLLYIYIPSIYHESEDSQSVSAVLGRLRDNPNQRRALLYMFFIVLGQFAVIPYISPFVVSNVGLTEHQLTFIYLAGGLATMFTARVIGKWADKKGPKRVFKISAIISLFTLVALTNMPPMPLYGVLIITTLFMIFISGRMIPTMTIISATVKPQNRGSFMSIVSSVQQISAGFATLLAGWVLSSEPSGKIIDYPLVGFLAIAASLVAMWILRRIKLSY
jgi:predicted MFS family arabinose efflux permease